MVNTKVTLSGIELDNPIIPASGTFGFGPFILGCFESSVYVSAVNPTPVLDGTL